MGECIFEIVDDDAPGRDCKGADLLDVISLHLPDERILYVQY